MKWDLKEGILNDADSGLWCCGSICHQPFTFIQIGSGHTVIGRTYEEKKWAEPVMSPLARKLMSRRENSWKHDGGTLLAPWARRRLATVLGGDSSGKSRRWSNITKCRQQLFDLRQLQKRKQWDVKSSCCQKHYSIQRDCILSVLTEIDRSDLSIWHQFQKISR